MKLRSFLLSVLALFLFSEGQAQRGPLPADEIMQEAYQQAAKEKKNVIVIFHASWCGWCHRMDSSINDKNCKKFFDDNYVIRHLVVDESKDKKNLENPGADEFRSKYNGDKQGIPFWLIFDKNGNLLGDSQMRPEGTGFDTRGDNIGCPASAKEVEAFINLLKKTSKLSASQQVAIEKRFRQNEQ
jgi:thiol-disulfide isomerase/thioredoxin